MERRRALETSIEELEKANEMLKNNYVTINTSLDKLLRTFDIAVQRTLYNYVEILGIPAKKNENYIEVVKKIGDYLGLELSVVRIKRLGFYKQTKTKIIAVELLTYEQKMALMRNAHSQNLSTDCLRGNWKKKSIYINEYLTDHFRDLLFKTKMFANQNGFRFAWYRKCQILLKKNSWSTVYEIDSEADLQRIAVSNESTQSNEGDELCFWDDLTELSFSS